MLTRAGQPDPLDDPGFGSGAGGDVGGVVRDALGVLRRRWLVLCAIAATVFGLFVLMLLLMTPRYEAAARVKIDPKPTAMNGVGSDQSASLPDQSVVDTEVSVMRSRDIAAEVVRQLRLDNDREFTAGIDKDEAARTPTARMDAVVAAVQRGLSIDREKSTYLIDVGFKSVSADKAATIANAFAETYIRQTVARRTGTAEQQYAWLDKRLETLAEQARSADAAVAQYKASRGLTEGGQLGTITDQQIAPLSSQLATAQAASAAARSDLAVARSQMTAGGATAASSVLNSPAIQTLRASRASTQQTLSQLSARYGPRHPQTIQAEQQIAAIDSQITEEAQRIVGELGAKARAADAQTGSLAGELARLRGEQAGNARSAVAADSLTREAESKRNAFNQLANQTQQVAQGAQSSTSQAQIIEKATPPARPSSPKKALILGVGLLLALTLGIGTIAVQELLVSGFMDPRDVERQLETKFLTSVPMLDAKAMDGKTGTPADALVAHPMSPYAEAFRVIRSSLILSGDPPQVVALASTLPNEGKTTSALSLARVMALSGERTLVIDGDVRRSGLGQLVAQRPQVGLVEVLNEGADPALAILPDIVPGLDVLTSSVASFVAADLFGGPTFAHLLGALRERYDRIVIDTPPLLGVADARTLAALSDAVVLVLKWNDTPRRAARTAIDWLRRDNARVAGAVLTMVSPKAEAFGALYYSRAYAKYYQTA